MKKFKAILWDLSGGVAKITMNRPGVRNAQNKLMLEEMNAAFNLAKENAAVKTVILAGRGKDFSSGHDLSPENIEEDLRKSREERYELCRRLYLEFPLTIRDLPKPVIAQVQGHCIMGGLMLALACDFIVCSDDARFVTNATEWGISNEQFFALPWYIGVPLAKYYLFTGATIQAQTALRIGLVSSVVPKASLAKRTMELAKDIASKDVFALEMAKKACNSVLDIQGQREHLRKAFEIWASTTLNPQITEKLRKRSSGFNSHKDQEDGKDSSV